MRKLIILVLIIFLVSMNAVSQEWHSYTSGEYDLPSNNIYVIDIDDYGTMWVGTDMGMTAFDGTKWYSYSEADCLASNIVNDFEFMEKIELWVATDNGVSAIGTESLDAVTMATPYRTDNTELVDNSVNAIAIDDHHTRWFGTDAGISIFTGYSWITATYQKVILDNDVLAIDLGPDSIAYCGTEGGGIARLKLDNMDVITGASTIERPWAPLPIDTVQAVHIGSDGVQWYGTPQGLFRHEGIDSKQNWNIFTPSEGLPHRNVQAIAEDSTGKIWIGTMDGVTSVAKDLSSYENFSTANGLIDNDVRDIVVDSVGTVWFATAGGITRYVPNYTDIRELKVDNSRTFDLIQIYPNPFNMSTHIEFTLQQAGDVELAIYNISGQLICKIHDGYASQGIHIAKWNGADETGSIITSGVYFARLQTAEQVTTRKMLVIK